MVVHAIETEADISEFKASLVYAVSSRTARAIYQDPILNNNNNKNQQMVVCVWWWWGG